MGACEDFLPGEEIHRTFRCGKHGVAGLQNETGSIRVLKANQQAQNGLEATRAGVWGGG